MRRTHTYNEFFTLHMYLKSRLWSRMMELTITGRWLSIGRCLDKSNERALERHQRMSKEEEKKPEREKAPSSHCCSFP